MPVSKSLEERVASLEDRLAIIDLYAAYASALDDKNKELLERVFDENSFFESANPTVPARTGVEANWKRLMQRHNEKSFSERHITSAPVILRIDENGAEVTAECVIIKREDGGPAEFEMVGCYMDELVRKDGGWVFGRRRFIPDK
jgi:hypothetical protein